MDWGASGIAHEYTFELLDPWLTSTRGNLTVYDCSITEGYYTDSKASVAIEADADTWIDNSAIRIYDTATLGTDTEQICLGTFVCESVTYEVTDARRIANIDGLHPIDKLTTDLHPGDYGIPEGASVADWCESIITGAGCNARIADGVSGTFASSWVWEHGESCLVALNRACGSSYQVGADVYGNVTVSPYVEPYRRESSYTLTSTQITSAAKISSGDIVNRVVVQAEQDDTQLYASAVVAATHPWTWARLGRWYTKSYTESSLDNFSQSAVQALADHYLAENDGTTRKWELTCLYLPNIQCGDVITVDFGGETVRALVQQRKIKCGDVTMDLILDEVA